MTNIENFSLVKEDVKFNDEDLVIISDKGKRFNILNCPHKVKQEQVLYRQNIILDCIKNIIILKAKTKYKTGISLEKLNGSIENMLSTISILTIDIEKYKFAAKIQNEIIVDSEEYSKFVSNSSTSMLDINIKQHIYNDLLNHILQNDSDLFGYFTQQVFLRSINDTLITFITPILKQRGYELLKTEKEIV